MPTDWWTAILADDDALTASEPDARLRALSRRAQDALGDLVSSVTDQIVTAFRTSSGDPHA